MLNRGKPVIGLIAVLWAVELINLLLGHRLNGLGILPRTSSSLPGIILSPFLHHGILHLLSNTLPLLVLGWFVTLGGTRKFLILSVQVTLFAGAAVWCLARNGFHIGSSGLVFGFFGFLVAQGWYRKTPVSILLACLTLFLYAGLVWGILPVHPFISWEGHFFGLIVGILSARFQGPQRSAGKHP